ncbi:MAG: glycosyltransferase [Kiritimatiellales bacterium]|nr:glycosyltransferase [Kiritimatiellales bacterium]MCF7863510.1 glycosyltransferase [Kiritimatiellales bacterium]
MKIAWFHGNMQHTNSGGTRFVIDYSIGLRQQFNHEVTVFCDRASDEVVTRLLDADVQVNETDWTSTNNPFYWLTLPLRNRRKRKKLAYVERDFDCVVNSLFPMNVLVAGFNVPKVQMCYEPFAFFYDPGFLKNFTVPQQLFFRLMKVLFECADKTAVAKMDRILTVNKTNLPKIEAIYGRSAIVVYAGIDPKIYHRAALDEISQLRERHPGKPLLFHSTDLTGIKGTYPLLEVIKKLLPEHPSIKLLVTVYLDLPDGIARFKNRIDEMGLEANVEYLGCLPKEQLPLYYSAVDFVCQPSLNQPANWPLKEAMLCGTPIIGGAESEEVDGLNGTKIDVSDAEQSAARLNELFSRDRSSFAIDVEGLKRQYSIESCLAQFNDVVVSACK